MKVLVAHRRPELARKFREFCESTDKECFKGLEIEDVRDTNAKRYGNFEAYVQKMEKEGPDWTDPDQEVLDKIADADILLIEWAAVSRKVIEAGKNLKLIATIRSGADNIQVEAARERGISVSISPSRLAEPVADMTIALILSEVRGILRRNLISNQGQWVEEKYDDSTHSALCNLTFGLVGYGGIARTVARRLIHGFGARVLAYEPITPREVLVKDAVEPVSLEELCTRADVVSMHARLCPETRGMFGKEQFSRMKPNALFINTARAGLVDEGALIQALKSGQIRGAGLDVYEKEPLPLDSPLLQMDNVTLMPHSAGITSDIVVNSLKIITQELERFLTGQPLKFTV